LRFHGDRTPRKASVGPKAALQAIKDGAKSFVKNE
jgi:hypothetical protein